MGHSEEKWYQRIRKTIKDRYQCTRSNTINGNFGQIARKQTMCLSYRTLPHVGKRGLNQRNVKFVLTKTTRSEGLYDTP